MFTSKSSRNWLEVSGWCSYECIAGKDLEDLTLRFIFLSPGALEEPMQVGSGRLRQQKGPEVSPSRGTSHQAYPKEFFLSPQLSPQMFLQNVIFHSVIQFSNHHLSKSKNVLNYLGQNFQELSELSELFPAPSSVLSLPEKSPPFSGVMWVLLPWAVMVPLTFW